MLITNFDDVEACLTEIANKISSDQTIVDERLEKLESDLEDTMEKLDCHDFELDEFTDFMIQMVDKGVQIKPLLNQEYYRKLMTKVAKQENRDLTERERINMFLKDNYKCQEMTELERFEDFLKVNFSPDAIEEALTILQTDVRQRMKEDEEQKQSQK